MEAFRSSVIVLNLFLYCGFGSGTFVFPTITLQAKTPRGFVVSIPDQQGVELFAFHGKLNDRLDSSKEGDIVGDINSPTNGKWTFEDPDLELSVGDKLYYWVYVQFNRAGYSKRELMWEVTELSGGTCVRSSTTVTGSVREVCSGNILFEDEFDGTALDRSKWITQQYIASIADDDHYEFVSYQDRDENRFVRSSVLHLKPTAAASRTEVYGRLDLSSGCTRTNPLSCTYQQVGGYILPPVVSAKIISKVAFKYGKIEVRARLPLGDWIYPQIELIPNDKPPQYPKMLIAYSRGNANLTLNSNEDIGNSLLFGGPVSSREEPQRSANLRSHRLAVLLGRTMRTYTLTWSPSRIDVMVDNVLYGSILPHEYAGFDSELHIALGVGVGGNYDFPDGIKSGVFDKPWRNFDIRPMNNFFDKKNNWISTWIGDDIDLQVDSVKVWAL